MTDQVIDTDLLYLGRCVDLAAEAVEMGDFPSGEPARWQAPGGNPSAAPCIS